MEKYQFRGIIEMHLALAEVTDVDHDVYLVDQVRRLTEAHRFLVWLKGLLFH